MVLVARNRLDPGMKSPLHWAVCAFPQNHWHNRLLDSQTGTYGDTCHDADATFEDQYTRYGSSKPRNQSTKSWWPNVGLFGVEEDEKDKYEWDSYAYDPSDLWIPHLHLTYQDKVELMRGDLLSDKHIYAAHKLLSEQFPDIGGLQDCLLSQTCFKPVYEDSVQIHHTRGLHWVVSSWTEGNVVNVYDTFYSSVSKDLLRQMDEIYVDAPRGEDGTLLYQIIHTQKQESYQDCGLFAIAIAYELCKGIDVSDIEFEQRELRRHLHDCFQCEQLSSFPVYDAGERYWFF